MMKTEKKKLASYGRQIKLDKTHAQVLIELGSEVNIIGKARKIIEEIGVRTIQTLSPQWILAKLDVGDMRKIVLKLTQNGFLKIEGYNASSSLPG